MYVELVALDLTRDRSTRWEDSATMGFALWTLVGLLVDAYFHSTDSSLESFWTPWHALFYSGFTATAIWLMLMALRRRRPRGTVLDWAPIGYRLAIIGIGLFGLGGIGDAIWHSVLGVETSLDALLSPTHLLLFLGLLLIVSAPFRAAWTDDEQAPTMRDFAPTLASLTFSVTLVAFFFEYLWAPVTTWPMRVPYSPDDGNLELIAAFAVIGVIVSTFLMFAPLLVASRRWRLPFGTATIAWTVIALFIGIGFDEDLIGIPAVVAGGLVFDILIQANAHRRLQAAVPAGIMWIVYFAIIGQTEQGLGLAIEIWSGAIFFAVLMALAIDLIMELAVGATLREPAPH